MYLLTYHPPTHLPIIQHKRTTMCKEKLVIIINVNDDGKFVKI